jgi:hypothetical protein
MKNKRSSSRQVEVSLDAISKIGGSEKNRGVEI